MLNFVKKAFKVYLEILLWVILIACAVLGAVIGSSIDSDGGFVGFILGAVFGLIVCVLGGGIIATFLKIEEHLEAIRYKGISLNKASANKNKTNNTKTNETTTKNIDETDDASVENQNYDTIVCVRCGYLNSTDDDVCQSCGAVLIK